MKSLDQEYDLIIVGGGINGAAIARDAALRGLKVFLMDKGDFASGASSKNSKLVHGGLRYLKNFQFKLIKESLKERAILLKIAPNLVHKLPFVVPVYKNIYPPLWMLKLGLTLYDFLSPPESEAHLPLSSKEISSLFPFLKKERLQGGCLYYDALMQDSRLVIENVLEAERAGAVVVNYTQANDFILKNKRIAGVKFQGGELFSKSVVNATGAWSNQFLTTEAAPHIEVYPTKGVHLVLPLIHATHALLLTAPQDGRVFFVIPWNGYTLLGTTDTHYPGNPDDVDVLENDIDYLLTAFNSYFPEKKVLASAIIAQFAGLRPLVKNHVKAASQMSRDFAIDIAASGLITLLGGKYTTFRYMAEQVVDIVMQQQNRARRQCQTQDLPLCRFTLSQEQIATYEKDVTRDQMIRIAQQYGSASLKIFELIKANPREAEQICAWHPHLWAELTHAIQAEKAKTPADWFERRTSIAYTECGGKKCAEAVAKRFAPT